MSVEEQDDVIEMLEKLKAKKLCVSAISCAISCALSCSRLIIILGRS